MTEGSLVAVPAQSFSGEEAGIGGATVAAKLLTVESSTGEETSSGVLMGWLVDELPMPAIPSDVVRVLL
jgi:hypothetical protein